MQASGGRPGPVEPENAGADIGDGLVEGVDVALDPFRVGRVAAGSVALEGHAEGEQLLDDMVVQVTRDAVTVLCLSQNDLVDAGPGEFHGHSGVACEGRSHV